MLDGNICGGLDIEKRRLMRLKAGKGSVDV